jgi:hypothetical protein
MKRFAIRRPKADELKAEIIRHWNDVFCAGTPPALNQAPKATPRPNQWLLSIVHKLLEENPIGTGFGRECLLAAVDERLAMADRKRQKRRKKNYLFSTKDGLAKNPFSSSFMC